MVPLTDIRLLLQVLYPRWRRPAGDPKQGFSILLPLPSDLPVFTRIAMRVLGRQSLGNVNEVVLVPDIPRASFREIVEANGLSIGVPVVLAEMSGLRRAVVRLYGRPNHFHWAQIVCGFERSSSRHVLFHDADMFLLDPDFLEDHYAAIVRRGLQVLGISPAWDPWFAANGYPHVTATWEMLATAEWVRSFPPVLLHGHRNRLGAVTRTFDTSYYAQCLSDPRTIGRRDDVPGFVHFNWLISGYRWFVKSRRHDHDDRFIILLLRLLIDEFDPGRPYPYVPSWPEISDGPSDGGGPLVFPPAETHADAYSNMRRKIAVLFASSLVDRTPGPSMDRKLEAFDRFYGYRPGASEPAA